MSKTKKVLSIILISLLILSTILTLCKKVGLCASSDTSSSLSDLPLPIGNGAGYDVNFDENSVEALNNYMARWNVHADYVLLNEVTSPDVYSVLVFYLAPEAPNFPSRAYIDEGSNLSNYVIKFEGFCGTYTFRNGQLDPNSGYGANMTSVYLYVSNFLNETSDSGFYTLKSGNLYRYPIYSVYDGVILDYNNDSVLFSPDNSGGSSGVSSDFIEQWEQLHGVDWETTVGNLNGDTVSDPTSLADWLKKINSNLISFFQRSIASAKVLCDTMVNGFNSVSAWLSDLYDKIEAFFGRVFETIITWLNNIFNKLGSSDDHLDQVEDNTSGLPSFITSSTSWMSSFWSNFQSNLEDFVHNKLWNKFPDIMKAPFRIASWFYNHGLKNGEFDFLTLWQYLFDFDSQTAYNLWSSNKYGDFILDVRDFFSNLISSITGVTASDRVFFVISLGDHFGVDIPDIEIDFSWYADIRDKYLPYLMAFLYVSVVWLFFKRLPDILKGVAGAESSFVDNLPHEFTDIRADATTHTISVTHGTRSRSGTTSSTARSRY